MTAIGRTGKLNPALVYNLLCPPEGTRTAAEAVPLVAGDCLMESPLLLRPAQLPLMEETGAQPAASSPCLRHLLPRQTHKPGHRGDRLLQDASASRCPDAEATGGAMRARGAPLPAPIWARCRPE
jgi:hypothetical protein